MTKIDKLFLVLGLIAFLIGGFFAVEEWFIGPSFATNDAMIWTLPLVSYIVLALTSTGVSLIVAYGVLTGSAEIEIKQKNYFILAFALLLGGFAALSTEMGSPFHVIWLIFSPNLKSPIWWMGSLYAIELVLLLTKIYRLSTGAHGHLDRYLTLITFVVAGCAAMVLGSVFGTVIGRDGFSGMDASLLTILCAVASGSAALLLTQKDSGTFVRNAQWGFGLLAVFIFVKWIYLIRSSHLLEPDWANLALVLAVAVSWYLLRLNTLIASALLLVSALLVEINFVVQGQFHVLGPKTTWFGAVVDYTPNISEVGILIFGLGVFLLAKVIVGMISEKLAA